MADSDAVALAVRAAFDQTPEEFISGRHTASGNSLHPREADFVGGGEPHRGARRVGGRATRRLERGGARVSFVCAGAGTELLRRRDVVFLPCVHV